jgi:hypothetical protein
MSETWAGQCPALVTVTVKVEMVAEVVIICVVSPPGLHEYESYPAPASKVMC